MIEIDSASSLAGDARDDAPNHAPRGYPDDVDWGMALPPMSMNDFFDEAAGRFAGRPMIDFLGRIHEYAEIADRVERMARGLQRLGMVKGDRVALLLPNTATYVIAYFGVMKAGGVVVNVNPLYAPPEIENLLRDSGAELAVTLDLAALLGKLSSMPASTPLKRIIVSSMADELPWPKNWLFPWVKRRELARWRRDHAHVSLSEVLANDGRPEPVAIDPERDLAVLQYTGGTTGVPKGAMLTHANLTANVRQAEAWFVGARPGAERMLGVLPFFHVFAMTAIMNLAIRLGAEIVALPRFELDQVMEVIGTKRPTFFPAVPTIYAAINNHPKRAEVDMSSIRFCISGGAPLPVEVRQTFMGATGCALVEGYGLSECSPVATCNPVSGTNRAGSIGLPLPGTTIEIVSLEDRGSPVAPGAKGEVCVRGPQVMAGYWNRPAESAEALEGGRLHTGDVGYLDDDGYVFIVDRIKDVIIAGGYKIYPRNVEEAIHHHPDVAECVVLGLPDPYRGQTVKAFVRARDGASIDAEALRVFLRDHLSPMEIPKSVEIRDELPRTMIGKLSRKALLEEEEARRTAGNDPVG